MKTYFAYLLLMIFVHTTSVVGAQKDIPVDIKQAILSGNSQNLSSFFSQNVELMIKNKEDVYSKAQAEHILKNFFSKNKPEDFIVEIDSQNESTRYAIGNLITTGGNYRIYLVYQKINGRSVISRLNISDYDN